jgi:two-component system phosphate regulon sensor histidine kinase PhoR
MSAACAAVVYVENHMFGSLYANPQVAYLNTLSELAFYLITSYYVAQQRVFTEKLRSEAELKTSMVSMVSHEFNNAMSKINLAAQMLEETEEAPSEMRGRFYRILKQTTGQLTQLTKTFLNKARLEAGKLSLNIRPTELRRLVAETLESLQLLSEEKGVGVATDSPQAVIPIAADPDALSLAVSNLIGNAIKYTPAGGKVTIRIAPLPGDGAVFSVEDTGIGIAHEDLNKLLSGFYRAEAGKSSAKGFGVGLKVTRELLEAHGASLQIESAPGKGSRFFFSLPVHQGKA